MRNVSRSQGEKGRDKATEVVDFDHCQLLIMLSPSQLDAELFYVVGNKLSEQRKRFSIPKIIF
jgi:hypothetical protein